MQVYIYNTIVYLFCAYVYFKHLVHFINNNFIKSIFLTLLSIILYSQITFMYVITTILILTFNLILNTNNHFFNDGNIKNKYLLTVKQNINYFNNNFITSCSKCIEKYDSMVLMVYNYVLLYLNE